MLKKNIPLHPAQENVFYEQIIHKESPMYTIGCYTVMENCDLDSMQQVWDLLHNHLDSLRLSITLGQDGQPVQFINDDVQPELISFYDFSEHSDPEQSAQNWVSQQTDSTINFMEGEVYHVSLLRINANQHYFFTRLHHIIIDGVGTYQLHEYIKRLYLGLKSGKSTTWLSEIPQYQQAVEKAHQYINSARYDKDKAHWKQFIDQCEGNRLSRRYQTSGSESSNLTLPTSLVARLHVFCNEHSVNMQTVLTGTLGIVMGKLIGQNDFFLNISTHGRRGKQGMEVVGMHSNLFPIFNSVSDSLSFIEQINKTQSALKSGQRRHLFPQSHLSRLTNNSGWGVDINVSYDMYTEDVSDDSRYVQQAGQNEHLPFMMRFSYASSQVLKFETKYSLGYFKQEEIEQLLKRLQNIISQLIDGPETPVGDLSILLPEERHTLLHTWNPTVEHYPRGHPLHQLFEIQVEKTPNNIALEFEGQELSYQEVNRRSNLLAGQIQAHYFGQNKQALKADTLIALYQDKTPYLVISMLAILKAGGAYVPISTTYPLDRSAFILQDTQTSLVLTDCKTQSKNQVLIDQFGDIQWIAVDDTELQLCSDQYVESIISNASPNSLGAVIYTSGTTGNPKGVMVEQHSMADLVVNADYIDINNEDVFLFLSSPVFDLATFEIWGALLNGAKLIIPLDTKELASDLVKFKAILNDTSVLWVTRSLFDHLYMSDSSLFNGLKYLLVGGEALTPEIMMEIANMPHCPAHILNGYGPTEATTFTTTYEITPEQDCKTIPIGSGISNRKLYVLNTSKQLVPIGVVGELYIGGKGLARGYLNRDDLNATSFIDNPYASERDRLNGAHRLYKSGDLVRWLPCGNLEYIGRNDSQVKIRGFRIELGEIERVMTQLEGVKQAVVVDIENEGSKSLVAYIIAEKSDCNIEVVRDELERCLPDYMVPASYTLIERIPLTINGKLDRNALPDPELFTGDTYEAPCTDLQRKLCTIWQDVLGLKKVGINDNFFRIGGDSIGAIKLTVAIRQELNMEVPSALLFESSSIRELILNINNVKAVKITKLNDAHSIENTQIMKIRL